MKDQETLRFSFKKTSLWPKGIIKSNFFWADSYALLFMQKFICYDSSDLSKILVVFNTESDLFE